MIRAIRQQLLLPRSVAEAATRAVAAADINNYGRRMVRRVSPINGSSRADSCLIIYYLRVLFRLFSVSR